MNLGKVSTSPIVALALCLYCVGAISQDGQLPALAPVAVEPSELTLDNLADSVPVVVESLDADTESEGRAAVEVVHSAAGSNLYDLIALIIAGIALLVSVINSIFTFFFRRDDRNSSIIDNFWLREVLIPQAIEPINQALLNSKFRFQKTLTDDEIRTVIESLEDLKQKLSIVAVISGNLTVDFEEIIDELSVRIVDRSNPQLIYGPKIRADQINSEDPYLSCYKKLVSKMVSAHKTAKNI